jgi:hypothetical protein
MMRPKQLGVPGSKIKKPNVRQTLCGPVRKCRNLPTSKMASDKYQYVMNLETNDFTKAFKLGYYAAQIVAALDASNADAIAYLLREKRATWLHLRNFDATLHWELDRLLQPYRVEL